MDDYDNKRNNGRAIIINNTSTHVIDINTIGDKLKELGFHGLSEEKTVKVLNGASKNELISTMEKGDRNTDSLILMALFNLLLHAPSNLNVSIKQ